MLRSVVEAMISSLITSGANHCKSWYYTAMRTCVCSRESGRSGVLYFKKQDSSLGPFQRPALKVE